MLKRLYWHREETPYEIRLGNMVVVDCEMSKLQSQLNSQKIICLHIGSHYFRISGVLASVLFKLFGVDKKRYVPPLTAYEEYIERSSAYKGNTSFYVTENGEVLKTLPEKERKNN